MRYLFFLLASAAYAQTLGQFRLVDFTPRTAATVLAVDGTGIQITTTAPHGRVTGDQVYIFPMLTYSQDESLVPPYTTVNFSVKNKGNRGRGYFIITRVDDTHFTLTSEMYSGATGAIGNGTSAGDRIVPLTTYYLRQGPRVMLDGPVDKGAWSGSTAYKALEMVSRAGTSYLCILAHSTSQQPPNATYWSIIDPALVGPGAITASMRDVTGKANPTNFMLTNARTWLNAYWGPAHTYPFASVTGYLNGQLPALSTWMWLMQGATADLSQAMRLVAMPEVIAAGGVGCNEAVGTGYCGNMTDEVDYSRMQSLYPLGALGVLYETLTAGQKTLIRDVLLNDLDVTHNGTETTGDCYNPGMIPSGLGVLSWSKNVGTVAGGGLTGLTDLQAGSVIYRIFPGSNGKFNLLGRVKSIDSDTQITFEYGQAEAQLATATYSTTTLYQGNYWFYIPPFGYGGQKTCGVKWFLGHHAASPRMIPGQENNYGTNYKYIGNMDDSPRNNRTISGLMPNIMMAMLLGGDDLRAVRLGEQAINYYMTQTMAQEQKSRWTGTNGHGTQYGPDRVESAASAIAHVLKNSLTVTPPGILTGNYLQRILDQYNYAIQNGTPRYVQPWTTTYPSYSGFGISERLQTFGHAMLAVMDLYPNNSLTPVLQHYLTTRRGDYGSAADEGGWGLNFTVQALPHFNPTAPATAPTSLPLQTGLLDTDADECVAAGLYCRLDTSEYIVFSTTGWGTTDTQLIIRGMAALPKWDEDNFGEAGSITILQNNGAATVHVLGGNGNSDNGLGNEMNSSSGTTNANVISIHNGTSDLMGVGANADKYMYAKMDRWAGAARTGVADNSYVYTRINYTPTVREAATGYAAGSAVPKNFYLSAAQPISVTRDVVHLKSGPALPNYLIAYDSVQTGVANQLRAYWHLQSAARSISYTGARRNIDRVTTDYANKAASLVNPSASRLNLKVLPVSGATNGVALTSEDYAPASGWYGQSVAVTAATWTAGTATITVSGGPAPTVPAPAPALPVGSTITVAAVNPAGFNGTYTVTGYATNPIRISYAIVSDPGVYASGGTLRYPAWCSYPSTFNPSGSCAGNYNWNPGGDTAVGKFPGTYRVHACASTNGTSCASVTSGEWVTVLQPTTNTALTMPTITQPTCTSSGGNCTVVQIADATYPKVAVFARQGASLTQVAFTSTHSGTAQYVISGLAAGQYTAYRGATPIVSNVNVTAADTSMTWSSAPGAITVGPATPIPLLIASPGSLPFICAAGGANPANQSVAISATIVTLNNWSATKTAAWIASLTPTSNTAASNLTVAVSCSGLSAGTYTDTISIASTTTDISNSPQTVSVTLTVTSAPLIALSPTSLAYTCVAGGSNPANKTVAISATGTTMDNWSATRIEAWTALTPSSNTVASALTVAVDCGGLNAGVYHDTISVASTTAGIGNSPQTVAVTLTVTAASTMALAPTSLSFICTALGTNPASQSLSISSGGTVLDNWSASKLSAWLTLSPTSNTAASSMTVTASCVGLTDGSYSDTITVASTTAGISNSPQTAAVYLTVNPAVTVTTSALADATWRTLYAGSSLAASGGTGPYTYAIVEGELPNGMSLSSAGVVTGTPCLDPAVACAAGIFTIGVTATDALLVVSPEKFVTLNVVGSGRSIGYGGAVKRGGQ